MWWLYRLLSGPSHRGTRKTNGRPCWYCAENSCSIYEERPRSCRDYKCQWLSGNVPEERFRPDKTGIVQDIYRIKLFDTAIVILWEAKENALRQPEAWELMRFSLSKARLHICLWPLSGKRIFYLNPEAKPLKITEREARNLRGLLPTPSLPPLPHHGREKSHGDAGSLRRLHQCAKHTQR